MDEIIRAIRKRAQEQDLRPYTLHKQGGLPLKFWQALLDREEIGRLSHANVMAAAAQLGLKPRVN